MRAIDITGQKFGKLTVIKRLEEKEPGQKVRFWLCSCECGGSVKASASYLRGGGIKSCGCLKHKNWDAEKKQDLAGRKFHSLTVIQPTTMGKWGWLNWLCLCDCGEQVEVPGHCLLRGVIKSCGCRRGKDFKHKGCLNGREEPLYRLWHHIKQRCYRKKNDNYAVYGGRGIYVCDEWLNDYATFRKWALQNGYKKGLQIDRIDNDGPYSPENCQFLSPAENTRKQPQVKLSPRKILVIRRLLSKVGLTTVEIGKMYGVSGSTISAIKCGKRWGDVSEADWKNK